LHSLWLVITALAAFAVAYRFYGAFLASKVAVLNDTRQTPAHRLQDDLDYQPTRRLVLFGAHFAAIAGPGPLVGPVLAAQWGYFPGFAWIVIGACLAGGVHDFVVLLASVRQDGLSLPKIARNLLGPAAGATATVATLFIIIATLAGVGMVVVNALSQSPWGMFTILVTIPAAMITGVWMYKVRPGRVTEATVIGVTLVMLGVILGKPFGDSPLGHYLTFSKHQLSILLPAYAAVASILPVWVLFCPRGYLSSYMKIGVIAVLAVGIFIANPVLAMPAATPFISGGGPVVKGAVWPFVCIVIMCGALSGFHALISSGTTPKMINKESDIRPIGYGAMLVEGFVSITALVAACALPPGEYFKINIPQDKPAQVAAYGQAVQDAKLRHGFDISVDPVQFSQLEKRTGEQSLAGKVGGAVTLAVGMASIFSGLPGMRQLTAYWYHFVIMFEALFILTLLETGTRVARFIFQESLDQLRSRSPAESGNRATPWAMNVVMSLVVCFLWGYLLYTGSIDSLWRMMGIANQLLAAIALVVGTTYLLAYAPKRIYALTTAIPLTLVVVTVFTAGIQSIGIWWKEAGDAGLKLREDPLALVKTPELLSCLLAGIMLLLSASIVLGALRRWGVMLFGKQESPKPVPAGSPSPTGRGLGSGRSGRRM
jgi:carbon starvation protein